MSIGIFDGFFPRVSPMQAAEGHNRFCYNAVGLLEQELHRPPMFEIQAFQPGKWSVVLCRKCTLDLAAAAYAAVQREDDKCSTHQ